MSFVDGAGRHQISLLPACVEDYVAPDALVLDRYGGARTLHLNTAHRFYQDIYDGAVTTAI
jgi:hypothetical protein